MGYDYELKTTFKSGKIGGNTYQELIYKLGIVNEELHGAKLSAGGVPQVMSVIRMVKDVTQKNADPIENITAYFQGNAIASTGGGK